MHVVIVREDFDTGDLPFLPASANFGATGICLGTKINFLRRATSAAANSGLGTTTKYLVNRNRRAQATTGPMATTLRRGTHFADSCSVAPFVVNSEPRPGHVPRLFCAWGPGVLAVFTGH